MIEMKKLLYRYDETAELLSVSKQTVRRAVEAGELAVVYVGRKGRDPRITAGSIRRYVERKIQEEVSAAR